MKNKLILGTAQLGLAYGINNTSGQPSREESFSILNLAREEGIRFLDTAAAYGDSQQIIGEFFSSCPNSQFKILSKFKQEDENSLTQQFERMQKHLGREQVYSYSYHQFEDLSSLRFKEELLSLKQEGKVLKIGVSIYDNIEFAKAIKLDFVDIIQLPFNLLDNWSIRGELIKKAYENKKEIHVRSVFLQGLFYREVGNFGEVLKPLENDVALLQKMSRENGISIGALALGYVLSFQEVSKVVIGVEKRNQLEEVIKFSTVKISNKLIEDINSISIQTPKLLDPRSWK